MRGRSQPVTLDPLDPLAPPLEDSQEGLAAMHIVEAAYDADEEEPGNAQVRTTMLRGLPGCTRFKSMTPFDIQDDVVDVMNKYGKSSGFSPKQLVDHIKSLKVQWNAYLEDNKDINSDKLGSSRFEKCQENWLYNIRHETRIPTFTEFKQVRAFVNWLDKSGSLMERMQDFWSNCYDSKTDVSVVTVFRNCGECAKVLSGFSSTIPHHRLQLMIEQLLRACCPTTSNAGGIRLLFRKVETDHIASVLKLEVEGKMIKVAVKKSKSQTASAGPTAGAKKEKKPSAKAKAKAAAKQAEGPAADSPPAKRRRLAGKTSDPYADSNSNRSNASQRGKTKASPLKRTSEAQRKLVQKFGGDKESQKEEIQTASRRMKLVEDLSEKIELAGGALAKKDSCIDQVAKENVEEAIQAAYQSWFLKSATYNNKEFNSWPKLKKEILVHLLAKANQVYQALFDEDATASNEVRQELSSNSQFGNVDFIEFKHWVAKNVTPGHHVAFQEAFLRAEAKFKSKFADLVAKQVGGGIPEMDLITGAACTAAEAEFPQVWMDVLKAYTVLPTDATERAEVIANDPHMLTIIQMVFPKNESASSVEIDDESVLRALSTRCTYIWTLLGSIFTDTLLPRLDTQPQLAMKLSAKSLLALQQQSERHFWAGIWNSFRDHGSAGKPLTPSSIIDIIDKTIKNIGSSARTPADISIVAYEDGQPQVPPPASGNLPENVAESEAPAKQKKKPLSFQVDIENDIFAVDYMNTYCEKQAKKGKRNIEPDDFPCFMNLLCTDVWRTKVWDQQVCTGLALDFEKKAVLATTVAKSLCLPFVGDMFVHDFSDPMPLRMMVAQAYGCSFAVKPREELFCPSWLVGVVEDANEANMVLRWNKEKVVIWEGSKDDSEDPMIEATVSVPLLTPKPEIVGKKGVVLTRPRTDGDAHAKKLDKERARLWTVMRAFVKSMGHEFPAEAETTTSAKTDKDRKKEWSKHLF